MKGQTTTEWIILGSFSFIVLIIIIASLADLSNIGIGIQKKTGYWENAEFSLRIHNTTAIEFQNNLRYQIVLQNITFGNSTKIINKNISTGEKILIHHELELGEHIVQIKYTNKQNQREYIFKGDRTFILE